MVGFASNFLIRILDLLIEIRGELQKVISEEACDMNA